MNRLSNKKLGNSFEESFELSARYDGWTCIKIPDGSRTVGNNKMFRVANPFDFLLAKDGVAVFCDVKTVEGKMFPHSKINQNQVTSLLSLHTQKMIAGYVIYFRESKIISFFSAKQLATLAAGESLKPDDGIKLGSLGSFDLNLLG